MSAHASLKDSFAALGSRMQPMPVKPLPDSFDCEGAGAGQGFQQLPSRLDDDAYVSLQALPSDLDPDAAFGEGCVPPMGLPSELLPEAHLQEGGNAGGGVRRLPSRLDEDELAGSQQVQPSSWPNPAHRGRRVRAAVQIRIKKNRKIKKTQGPDSGHGLPNVSTSVSLPWGKALRVDKSLNETLQPDILDGDHYQERLDPSSTAGMVKLVALFAASFTAATQFDIQQGQDLLVESCQSEAWKVLAIALAVFVCPPCRLYSSLMQTNWPRMSVESRLRVAVPGLRCLKFAMEACHAAARSGKQFCFEHPERSRALVLNFVKGLLQYEGAAIVVFDQCMYGLRSPAGSPVRKRTVFITNSAAVIREFHQRLCDGSHTHRVCQGYECGIRVSKHCERYPLPLVQALQKCFDF